MQDSRHSPPFLEKIYLVGQREAIEAVLNKQEFDHSKIEIVEASEVIEMEDHPANAYRRKKDASITVATRLVKEKKAEFINLTNIFDNLLR